MLSSEPGQTKTGRWELGCEEEKERQEVRDRKRVERQQRHVQGENGSMYEKWIELDAVRLRKKKEEKKREAFKTPVLILKRKQLKTRKVLEITHCQCVCGE